MTRIGIKIALKSGESTAKRKGIIFRGKITAFGKSLLAGSEVGVAFDPVHFRYEEYLAKSVKQGYPTPEVQELISIARRNFLSAV